MTHFTISNGFTRLYVFVFIVFIFGTPPGAGGVDEVSEIAIPVTDQVPGTPVAILYTSGWGLAPESAGEPNIRVIVAVWEDGTMMWSEDSMKGGAPYRRGTIEPAAISELKAKLERRNAFEDSNINRHSYGPDSRWSGIVVRGREAYLDIRTWHELAEMNPNVVSISGSLRGLNGRNRDEVLAEDSKEYRGFRSAWSKIKAEMLALIPVEAQTETDSEPGIREPGFRMTLVPARVER